VRDRVHVELLNSAQRVTGTGKRSRRDQIARRRCRSPFAFCQAPQRLCLLCGVYDSV